MLMCLILCLLKYILSSFSFSTLVTYFAIVLVKVEHEIHPLWRKSLPHILMPLSLASLLSS